MPDTARHVTRHHAARDILTQVVARVLNLALGVVVTALVVRTLGRDAYGQWSTIFIVLTLIGSFATFGAETIALREVSRAPEQEHEWLGALMMMRMVTMGPVVLACALAMVLMHQSREMLIASLILVAVVPFSSASVLQLIFKLRVRNLVPMLVLTLKSVLWGVAVLLIFLGGGGMIALAIAMTLTSALTALIQSALALRRVDRWPRPSRARLGMLLRASLPVGISGVLVIAYARIDQVIVFSIAGSGPAGLYGSAYNILEQAHFVPISILTTMAPVIAASWPADVARMRRAARLAAELLAIASFGGVAFALTISDPVVRLIFGQQFVPGAAALPVLAGAFVFICFDYLTGNLIVVLGEQRRLMMISLAALVVNLAGNLIAVPLVGFMGAAWMTLATEIVVFLGSMGLILRRLELPLPRLGRIGRSGLAAAGLCGCLALLNQTAAPLWLSIAGGCAIYLALLLGIRAVSPQDLRILLRRDLQSQW